MANKNWLNEGTDGLRFGERLEDLIKRKKTTAMAVSRETGVAQSALSGYLNKNRAPDCAAIIALAKYFSVSTDYLLGLTGDPSITPAATDELGLSADAIYWIKERSSDPIFGAEFRDIFSKLLKTDAFQILLDSLFDCIAAARAERIELDIYEQAYYANPDNIVERHKRYSEDVNAAGEDPALDPRVRLFIKANKELNQLHESSPTFSAILGDGIDTNSSSKRIGVHGLADGRANRQLFDVLECISNTYGISGG